MIPKRSSGYVPENLPLLQSRALLESALTSQRGAEIGQTCKNWKLYLYRF